MIDSDEEVDVIWDVEIKSNTQARVNYEDKQLELASLIKKIENKIQKKMVNEDIEKVTKEFVHMIEIVDLLEYEKQLRTDEITKIIRIIKIMTEQNTKIITPENFINYILVQEPRSSYLFDRKENKYITDLVIKEYHIKGVYLGLGYDYSEMLSKLENKLVESKIKKVEKIEKRKKKRQMVDVENVEYKKSIVIKKENINKGIEEKYDLETQDGKIYYGILSENDYKLKYVKSNNTKNFQKFVEENKVCCMDISNMTRRMQWTQEGILMLIRILNSRGMNTYTICGDIEVKKEIMEESTVLSTMTHDDILLLNIAINRGAVIISNDKYSEFSTIWYYCKKHNMIVNRKGATCVSHECILTTINNNKIRRIEIFMIELEHSSVVVSISSTYNLDDTPTKIKYEREKLVLLKRQMVVNAKTTLINEKEQAVINAISYSDLKMNVICIQSDQLDRRVMYMNYNKTYLLLEVLKGASLRDKEMIVESTKNCINVVDLKLVVLIAGETEKYVFQRSEITLNIREKYEILENNNNIKITKEKEMDKDFKVNLMQNYNVTIYIPMDIKKHRLAIVSYDSKVEYAVLTESAVALLSNYSLIMIKKNQLMSSWYGLLDADQVDNIFKKKINVNDLGSLEKRAREEQIKLNSKNNVWATMMEAVTISDVVKDIDELVNMTVFEKYKVLGSYLYNNVLSKIEGNDMSSFKVVVKEEMPCNDILDAVLFSCKALEGDYDIMFNIFDDKIFAINKISQLNNESMMQEETARLITVKTILGSLEEIILRNQITTIEMYSNVLTTYIKDKKIRQVKLLRKYDIGESWDVSLGNKKIVGFNAVCTIVINIIVQPDGKNSVMYVANFISMTVCDAILRNTKDSNNIISIELVEEKSSIISEKAMMVMFDVIEKCSSIHQYIAETINDQMATVMMYCEIAVVISEFINENIVDVATHMLVNNLYQFEDNKFILYNQVSMLRSENDYTILIKKQLTYELALAKIMSFEENIKKKVFMYINDEEFTYSKMHVALHLLLYNLSKLKGLGEMKRMYANFSMIIPGISDLDELNKHVRCCCKTELENQNYLTFIQIMVVIKKRGIRKGCKYKDDRTSKICKFNMPYWSTDRRNNKYMYMNEKGEKFEIKINETREMHENEVDEEVLSKGGSEMKQRKYVYNSINIIPRSADLLIIMEKNMQNPETNRMNNMWSNIKLVSTVKETIKDNYRTIEEAIIKINKMILQFDEGSKIILLTDDFFGSVYKKYKNEENINSFVIKLKENQLVYIPDQLLYNSIKYNIFNYKKVDGIYYIDTGPNTTIVKKDKKIKNKRKKTTNKKVGLKLDHSSSDNEKDKYNKKKKDTDKHSVNKNKDEDESIKKTSEEETSSTSDSEKEMLEDFKNKIEKTEKFKKIIVTVVLAIGASITLLIYLYTKSITISVLIGISFVGLITEMVLDKMVYGRLKTYILEKEKVTNDVEDKED